MFIESSKRTVTASLGGTRGMLVKIFGGSGGRLASLGHQRVCAGVFLEEGDGLGVSVFGDLKVFLMQPFYRLAVVPGYDHIEDDGAGVGLEDEPAVFVRNHRLALKGCGEERGNRAEKKYARQRKWGALKHRCVRLDYRWLGIIDDSAEPSDDAC